MSASVNDNPMVGHGQDLERKPSGGDTDVVTAPDSTQGAIEKVDPTEAVGDQSKVAEMPLRDSARSQHVATPAACGQDGDGDDLPLTAESKASAANAVDGVNQQLPTSGSAVVQPGTFHDGNCDTNLAPVRARQETRTFRLDEIKLDVQVRVPDEKVVEEYRVRMDEGDIFAPVEVLVVRSEGGGIDAVYVTDGGHRLAAMRLRRVGETECVVEYGDLRTAKLKAAGANKIHGLRMTNATKKEAVKVVLSLEYDWTDNRIATHVGVSPTFVANVRRKYDKEKGIADDPGRTRVSSSGRAIKPRAPKTSKVAVETADRGDNDAVPPTATETARTVDGGGTPVEGCDGQPVAPVIDADTDADEWAADQQVPRDDPAADNNVPGKEPVVVPVEVGGADADAPTRHDGEDGVSSVTPTVDSATVEPAVATAVAAATDGRGAIDGAQQVDVEQSEPVDAVNSINQKGSNAGPAPDTSVSSRKVADGGVTCSAVTVTSAEVDRVVDAEFVRDNWARNSMVRALGGARKAGMGFDEVVSIVKRIWEV